MSYPLHKPHDSGNQKSTHGRHGSSSIQAERDPQRETSHLEHGSICSSSGASAIPAKFAGILPQSKDYRPEQSRATIDKNIERSLDMGHSAAREDVRLHGESMHQPKDQGARFTSKKSDEFLSLATGMVSYPGTSTSASLRHSDIESGRSSSEWLLNVKRPNADDPSKSYTSSALFINASSDDSRCNASSEREHDMQSIPGLGDLDCLVPEKSEAPTESSRLKYTSESAANILQRFGLDIEDMEHLISYPEDQITPATLPFILRQIKIQKFKRAAAAVQSKPCPEPQNTRSVSEMDSHSLRSSETAGVNQKGMISVVHQPSKVADCGHTGKYTRGFRNDTGQTGGNRATSGGSGSMLLMETDHDSSRLSREPLPKSTTEVKSSALGSSRDQASPVSSLSSSYSSRLSSAAPPKNDQTKRLQTQPDHTSQTILGSFSLPKKDTDIGVHKCEAHKPVPSKAQKADFQSASKTQSSPTLQRGVHPSRPGLVVIGSSDASGTKDWSKTRGQGSAVDQQIKKKLVQKQSKEKMKQQQKPVSQTGQAMWPQVFSPAKSESPTSSIPSITDAMQYPQFSPGGPHPIGLNDLMLPRLPPSSRHPVGKAAISKGLPTADMMHDYAAATPRIFPHTCSLCNKECTRVQDWISHQNTNLHLESCRLLRTRAAGKDDERVRRGSSSSSRSSSPCCRHGSEGRREKRSSSSLSPQSSRYTRRSRSCSRSPRYDRPTSYSYWSHSRSPERRSTSRRSNERKWSSRRSDERRSPPRRSNSSQSTQPKKLSSAEIVAKKLLKTPAVEAVVESLTPASQAEIAKMSSPSSPSSSSPSSIRGKPSSSSTDSSSDLYSTAKKKYLSYNPSKAKPSLQKSEASSSIKTKFCKPSPPTMVKLQGIQLCVSYNDLKVAVEERFGKTKSVVLFRSKLGAIVIFEEERDAKKLTSLKSFDVKGVTIAVVKEQETVSKEQNNPPQKKPAISSVSTPQTAPARQVLLPTLKKFPLKGQKKPSGAIMATPGKLTNQKCEAKGSVKVLTTVTKAKVLASEVKNISSKLNTAKVTCEEPVKSPVVKSIIHVATSSGSKSRAPKNQPYVDSSKHKEYQKRFKEALPQHTAKVVEKADVIVIEHDESETRVQEAVKDTARVVEPQHQAEFYDANGAEDAEPVETGEMGVETAERMDGRTCSEDQGEKMTTTEALPENSDKSSESQSPDSSVETRPIETSVKALPHVQQITLPEPESTAHGPETKTEASYIQQQAAGGPTETTLKAKLPGRGVETTTIEEGPVTPLMTHLNAASASTAPHLTFGEMVEKHLQSALPCLKRKPCLSPKGNSFCNRQLLITNLPDAGLYTEDDLAKVLMKFGFQYADDKIYVVPQMNLAFVMMPKLEDVVNIMKRGDSVILKSFKLHLHPLASDIVMTQFGFYQWLMKMMLYNVDDDGKKTIFIKNISWSEAGQLGEVLKNIKSVKKYMPLLNKAFIEFESVCDADRIGVWYSLLKQAPDHEVHRLKTPYITSTAPPASLPTKALLAAKAFAAGVVVPPTQNALPQASIGPFWVPMRTYPFLFPTVSPWFIIPDHRILTVKTDIKRISGHGTMFPTIMLTGLPGENYKYEDVAKLVWRYFPKQNLHSLYYKVVVLPMQRRAFVFFPDWTTWCDFVQESVTRSFSVNGWMLRLHFVSDHMNPPSSEEMMYTTLMKWSNAEVKEPKSLKERLLCVEISETSVPLIRTVLEAVASIAPFASFLPLANRICIEMADSRGVTKVLEKYNTTGSWKKDPVWSKVLRFESLKSLKRRLQDSSKIKINFGPSTIYRAKCRAGKRKTQPPPYKLLDNGSQPALQTSGPGRSTISEPITSRSLRSKESEGGMKDQNGFTDGNVFSSFALLFEEPNFKSDDDVTDDKGGDYVGDTSPDPHTSSSFSAEDIAVKTIASVTKIETSSEMHPPLQGHGLELSKAQSLDIDLNVDTLTEQKKSKEEGKEDSKHTEVHEESFQVLDSADDEGKAGLQETSKMEIDSTFQVLDSATKDQAATGQEDSRLVQDDSSTEKQLSEEHAISDQSDKDSSGKAQKAKNEDNLYMLHKGNEQTPKNKGDEKKRREEEVKGKTLSAESFKASKDLENSDSRIANKDQPVQDVSDVPEQGTFEILDSADDQTATGDESQNLKTSSDQIFKEDTCQVTGAVEDQPVTTETEPETDKKRKRRMTDVTARKDDRPSKRSCITIIASNIEEEEKSPKKQDRTVTKCETRAKIDPPAGISKQDKEVNEELEYENVDSVENKLVKDAASREKSCRRRSARLKKADEMTLNLTEVGKKTEEGTFKVLDSDKDETVKDEPTITRRSTRGKGERIPTKEASNEKTKKENTSTTRRHTPARESVKQNREKTAKKAPPKQSTPSMKSDDGVIKLRNEEDATSDVLDSVKDDHPDTRRKGKGGRPKKDVATTKKEASEKVADEDATVQTLDSVEDELVDNQSPTGHSKEKKLKSNDQQAKTSTSLAGSPKNEEEEEEYQIIDELEDDQALEELTATEDNTKDETPTKGEASTIKEDTPTCGTTGAEMSEKVRKETLYQIADDLEKANNDQSAAKGSAMVDRQIKCKTDIKDKETVTLDEVGAESREWDGEITEGELEAFITLDELVEEEEDGKMEQTLVETHPSDQKDESADHLNLETLVTLDEAGDDDKEKSDEEQTEQTSRSAKRKHVDDKVVSKQRRKSVGPEAKRSCSQSPCVSDIKLPAFKPNNLTGEEFVVPKSVFVCNLCSVFYLSESTAMDLHCSSQRHHENLQKYYQKLQQKP
ncbi:zinc finger protein 638-like [Plectropomus leopardus]|uniref:zinc finger protein 638-like n=1 Tax=Plectropomus leopardus TaxID=160734 RepID=UPI001C4CA81A|nr:zinc finger protein 638-like [Plectropomus leopardus]XP_042368101.1 zinc finger protein 638-like [Plectropomus leopardus]XP_042368102.1 zinc finger protein 638-like [Plectropomus leopardus]XP_042368103.1 zinc finger protein 638-like [Plectropomus leopardus]